MSRRSTNETSRRLTSSAQGVADGNRSPTRRTRASRRQMSSQASYNKQSRRPARIVAPQRRAASRRGPACRRFAGWPASRARTLSARARSDGGGGQRGPVIRVGDAVTFEEVGDPAQGASGKGRGDGRHGAVAHRNAERAAVLEVAAEALEHDGPQRSGGSRSDRRQEREELLVVGGRLAGDTVDHVPRVVDA